MIWKTSSGPDTTLKLVAISLFDIRSSYALNWHPHIVQLPTHREEGLSANIKHWKLRGPHSQPNSPNFKGTLDFFGLIRIYLIYNFFKTKKRQSLWVTWLAHTNWPKYNYSIFPVLQRLIFKVYGIVLIYTEEKLYFRAKLDIAGSCWYCKWKSNSNFSAKFTSNFLSCKCLGKLRTYSLACGVTALLKYEKL